MDSNIKKSKLFYKPKITSTFRTIESPTSEQYVRIRKSTMQDLHHRLEGYSEAYLRLSEIHI